MEASVILWWDLRRDVEWNISISQDILLSPTAANKASLANRDSDQDMDLESHGIQVQEQAWRSEEGRRFSNKILQRNLRIHV